MWTSPLGAAPHSLSSEPPQVCVGFPRSARDDRGAGPAPPLPYQEDQGVLRRRRRSCRNRFDLRRGGRRNRRALFFVFLDQAADCVGGLRTARYPILSAIQFQRAVVIGFFGIVSSDDFDEFPVAGATAIRHHNFIIRAIFRPFSA
jgi:hypothetical protein